MQTVARIFWHLCTVKLCHVSGEIKHKRHSLKVLCFLFDQILITAAEMSMPDALRCWQDIPRFWRTGMFYPFPHHPCRLTDIKLKIHIEIPGHTQIAKLSKHQQMQKTFNSMVLCVHKSSRLGGLCSGGGPPWRVMGVDCIQYEYHCNTLSSVRQV